ncbi:hypothetical protein CHARACLAT_030955 [Characodon lateralis]|uniref:Uncharacterized protein n=1 Tax=Characodon lateralis TaxID=208331 RepID=A0ABU7F8D4_9TELE|nr:hypothetical protein [Characodon lateralis]
MLVVLQKKPMGHPKKPAVLKTRQVSPTPCVTFPSAGVEPVTPKKNAEATQDRVFVCDVPRSPSWGGDRGSCVGVCPSCAGGEG